jgi:hypothetical protein
LATQPIFARLRAGAKELKRGRSGGRNITLRGRADIGGDASCIVFAKLLDPRRLANELVASQMARALGILAPQSFIVQVSKESFPDLFGREQVAADHVVAFGSDALPGSPLSKQVNLENPSDAKVFFDNLKQWQPLCAFDSWIGNTDRHCANIVMDGSFRLWAIDHDRTLGTDTPFSSLISRLPRENRFLQDHGGKLELGIKHEVSAVSQELMKRAGILDISGEVADSCAGRWMTADDITALVAYIEQRLEMVDELVCESLGIPRINLA